MAKPKKRDSNYWLGRLKRDHIAIHAKCLSKVIPSVRAACIEAGLIRQPSRLDALKRSWKGASPADRRGFVDWLKSGGAKTVMPGILVDPDGYLRATIIKRIHDVMKAQRIKSGDVMVSMDYKKLDPRLGLAMARRWKPEMGFLVRLAAFLNAYVT
jgi:hypothetical protein